MRLTDLDPRWFDVPGVGGAIDGVAFLCPHCKTTRLGVQFTPIGAEPRPLMSAAEVMKHVHKLRTFDVPPSLVWQRTGETFETLTLSPSVDCSSSGHWHGFVQGGEIR